VKGSHRTLIEIITDIVAWFIKYSHLITHQYGLDIIILTIVVRGLLHNLTKTSTKSMRAMAKLQPKMKELQDKYKDNKQKLNDEMMALYKKEGVNPMGGCLPLALQMPIFIAIFYMLRDPHHYKRLVGFEHASFLGSHLTVKPFEASPLPDVSNLPGMLDLDKLFGGGWWLDKFLYLPALWLVVLYIVTTIYQTRLMQKQNPTQTESAKMQQYMFLPVFIIFGFIFPVGLLLYWGVSNIFQMFQTRLIYAEMDREDSLKEALKAQEEAGKVPRMDDKPARKKKKK
jgi:YidC/Oxa1 family membrane protein insertase